MITAHFLHGNNVLTLYATSIAHLVAFLRLWSTSGRVVDAVRLPPAAHTPHCAPTCAPPCTRVQ